MNPTVYQFQAIIQKVPDIDGAYVVFPYDLKTEFGKGRVKVSATFDGISYSGSLVNMGLKNEDGSPCYIIGIPKNIRSLLGRGPGDSVSVSIRERD